MSTEPLEPWKLTAYVLNELDDLDRLQVEAAIAQNAGLLAEVEAIRKTLDTTRAAMKKSHIAPSLDAARIATIQSAMHNKPSTGELVTPASELESNVDANSVTDTDVASVAKSGHRLYRLTAALSALAATLLIGFLVAPQVWQSQQLSQLDNQPLGDSESMASAPTRDFSGGNARLKNQSGGIAANASPEFGAGVGGGVGNGQSEADSSPAGTTSTGMTNSFSYNDPRVLGEIREEQLERSIVAKESTAPSKDSELAQAAQSTDSRPEPVDAYVDVLTEKSKVNAGQSINELRGRDGDEKVLTEGSAIPIVDAQNSQPQTGYATTPAELLAMVPADISKSSGGATLSSAVEPGRVAPSVVYPTAPATPRLEAVPSPIGVARGTAPEFERETLGVDADYALMDAKQIAEAQKPAPYYFDAELANRQAIFSASAPKMAPAGDRFESIIENTFLSTAKEPLSTFSIDVDTASYSKIRQYLLQSNVMPPPSSVRIEEMINYFKYEYATPSDEHPFASNMAVMTCPWNESHKLIRIGLQAKKVAVSERPKANLVFLLDVSGSMDEPNKLPLVKQTISMLTRQLGENDRIAIVVYAGAAGCVLPSTTGDKQKVILDALDNLQAGGSTNGGQGIELAYSIAREHFIPNGINRIILCTDGDFNVGTTSTEDLVAMVERNAKSKVFLTCLGYGMGNYNDTMMEQITNRGNGTYGMVDNVLEARRIMVEQLSGTLMTVAKDVKIQVEFNPGKISHYRLVGYENRKLANEDFNNDAKDAGEIGAGHCVTALYEVVPVGVNDSTITPPVDDLRYAVKPAAEAASSKDENAGSRPNPNPSVTDEWMTLKLRYKQPEGDVSTKMESFLRDRDFDRAADSDLRWATSVAEFGLLMRKSRYAPQADWDRMIRRAQESAGDDSYRLECIEMMIRAKSLSR